MNFDTADAMDDRYEVQVRQTALLISRYMKSGETTIGAIRRAFPTQDRWIMSALKSLKLVGEVDYCEFSPAPTRVYPRAMKRIERKIMPYNTEPIIHKDHRSFPTAAVSENYFRG